MLDIYNKYKILRTEDFDKIIKIKYRYIIDFFNIIDFNNLPNILLYGEEGSCKKLLVYNFFNNVEKNKRFLEYKVNYQNINFYIYYSKYYIEVDLSQFRKYKKILLIEFIKDLISTKNINGHMKILIIHNINLLGLEEQFILRKIIENNYNECRFILLSNTINNIIDPIKSRCITIKTPGFTKSFIRQKINNIILNENIEIKENIVEKILEISNKNLKKALLELDFYNNLKKNGNDKEYLIIKKNNKENLLKKYLNLTKMVYLNHKEIDEILYKIIYEVNLSYFGFLKYIHILLERNNLKDEVLYEIIDLNYNTSLLVIDNISKNKHIIFLQSYTNKLNEILVRNKINKIDII